MTDIVEQLETLYASHPICRAAAKEIKRLRGLVREWRDAQKAIDATRVEQRQTDRAPLERLIDAHNALTKYADEHLR